MSCLPVAAAARGIRRPFWTVALFAVALLLSSTCQLFALAAADRVPHLTPNQQKRAVTTIINHHSFSPPLLRHYYGDGEIPHWSMSGTTVITDNYVRLTADQESQTGHLWNTEPLDMDDFEVVVGFRAFRQMGGTGADGFAMWIAQPPRLDGNIFGRPANFNGFGILFDSYDNDNRRDNPMVSLVSNDGSNTYKLDPERDFLGQTMAHCIFDFRNILAPNMATLRLRYNKGTLSLHLSRNSEGDEQQCFTVPNLPMPSGKSYLAFSGQTGGVSEAHDIIFVHLSPIEGATYDRDVHKPVLEGYVDDDAQLYNNDAMNNRHTTETPTTSTTTTQSTAPQPPTQEEIEAKIAAETERRVAALERQRLEAELQRQQQQQQQQQQTTTTTVDPAEEDRRKIAELEKRIADLKRRDNRPQEQRPEDEEEEDEYEYEDEEANQPRRRRVRRARTPRHNTVDNNA